MTTVNDLLSNLAVVALTTSLWTVGQRHLSAQPAWLHKAAFGFTMAMGSIAVMCLPFEFKPGVFLDLRYTFLAVSGMFGGPLASLICLVSAAFMRLRMGGDGMGIGLMMIALASASGISMYRLNKQRIPSFSQILGLALMVAASGTIGFFFKLDMDRWPVVFPSVVAPFALILFVSAALAGVAVCQEIRRQAVTDENKVYRAIIEALPDCLNAKDRNGRFLAANPATANLMNASSVGALIGKTDADFYPSDTAAKFRADEEAILSADLPTILEQRFKRADGREAWLLTLKSPLRDDTGNVIGLVTHNREITEQKLLEQRVAIMSSRLSDAAECMADGFAMFDASGIQVYHNSRYLDLFPLTADIRVDGTCVRDMIRHAVARQELDEVPGDLNDFVERMAHALLKTGDRQVKLADGRWLEARTRPTSDGGNLIVFSDITSAKKAERDLSAKARTDSLTRLSNRGAFDEALDATVRDNAVDFSVILLDVDYFKKFNDNYGHLAGDECLKLVAKCMATIASSFPAAMAARYGGEEFVVLLPGCQRQLALQVANLIIRSIEAAHIPHSSSPFGIVTVTAGVASSNEAPESAAGVLKAADQALYEGKARGRNQAVSAADNAFDTPLIEGVAV